MSFNPQAFFDNLYYLGTGMTGIFIVIGIIIGVTALLNRLTQDRDPKE